MRSSFEIDDTIAIVVGNDYFDLHNCFDFVGYEYRPTEKRVRLEWARCVGDWISVDLPKKLTLVFSGVMNLAAHKRDAEMPFTEDSCVAGISFLPPELKDNFDAICQGYRANEEHLSIEFQSGSGIKIWAESVTHEIQSA